MTKDVKKSVTKDIHDEKVKNALAGKVQVIENSQHEVKRFFGPSANLLAAAEDTLAKCSNVLKGGYTRASVPEKTMETYYVDALRLRIKQIHNPALMTLVERERAKNYPMPAVVYNAIRQIGIAHDLVNNIKYVPYLDEFLSPDLELSDSEYEKCKRLLETVSNQSDLVVSETLNSTPTGDVYFMAMDNCSTAEQAETAKKAVKEKFEALSKEEQAENPTITLSLDEYKKIFCESKSQEAQKTYLDTHIVTGFYNSFFKKSNRTGMFANVFTEIHSSEYEMRDIINVLIVVDGSSKTLEEVVNELSSK